MERVFRQTWAFVFREAHLTRRYLSWVVAFTLYALVNSATIALIGVAQHDFRLTVQLTVGALLWSYLSVIFQEVANSISYERWEGTLEYTFMAPVSRLVHLLGVSLFAMFYSLLRGAVVLGGLVLFVRLDLGGANLWGLLVVLLVGSVAFLGLGLISAVLPVMSPEHGAQGTNILQGLLLLISGIYYPIEVLPAWLRPLAWLSPATYVLNASRKLLGIEGGPSPEAAHGGAIGAGTLTGAPAGGAAAAPHLVGAPLGAVVPELVTLAVMGVILVPLGLWVFGLVEQWAKRTGKLKRTG